MRSFLRQTRAVIAITASTLPQRPWAVATTIVSIALVVGVLLALLAISNGFRRTLQGSGADDVVLLLSAGANSEASSFIPRDQQRLLEAAPGIAVDADGVPLFSPELYVIVDAPRQGTGATANLSLRGLEPGGARLRNGLYLVAGRMFRPGVNELVVGAGVQRGFDGFQLGSEVRFGATLWRVVGVFAMPGTAFESEVWADLGAVQSQFNKGPTVQVARVRLDDMQALPALEAYLDDDARLDVDVIPERRFYADQSRGLEQLVYFGWTLAVILSMGAVAGALNTMYAAVDARKRDIATLRAIGFGGMPAFVSALLESVALAALGGLLGAGVVYVAFDGVSGATLSSGLTQIVFTLEVGGYSVVSGMIFAVVLGVFGGFLPAIRAARSPIARLGAD